MQQLCYLIMETWQPHNLSLISSYRTLLTVIYRPLHKINFVSHLITKEIVEADLSKIPSNKATGLDGISVRVLKEALLQC